MTWFLLFLGATLHGPADGLRKCRQSAPRARLSAPAEIAARMALGARKGASCASFSRRASSLLRRWDWRLADCGLRHIAGGARSHAFRMAARPRGATRLSVLIFCSVLSVLTSLVFGLIPALRATRVDLVSGLKPDAPGNVLAHRFGLRSVLVIAQVAICTVLLLCTGLFLRSLYTVQGMNFGVRNRNLLLMAFDPSLGHRTDVHSRQLGVGDPRTGPVHVRCRGRHGDDGSAPDRSSSTTRDSSQPRKRTTRRPCASLPTSTPLVQVFSRRWGSRFWPAGPPRSNRCSGAGPPSSTKEQPGPRPLRPVIVNDAFARAAFRTSHPSAGASSATEKPWTSSAWSRR